MKLTTITQITLDGVTQGNGGASDEDRGNGFERGGWARGKGDAETVAFINRTYERADAFLFGRRTYELFAGSWGTMTAQDIPGWEPVLRALNARPKYVGQGARLFPENGPDLALELTESRTDSKGVTIQVYRPAGRPRYATA